MVFCYIEVLFSPVMSNSSIVFRCCVIIKALAFPIACSVAALEAHLCRLLKRNEVVDSVFLGRRRFSR